MHRLFVAIKTVHHIKTVSNFDLHMFIYRNCIFVKNVKSYKTGALIHGEKITKAHRAFEISSNKNNIVLYIKRWDF